MNVKEIAKLWGVSTKTVYSYCQKGYILGAYKKGKVWVIPDNYKQPYISRKKKFKTSYEKMNYVLLAYDSRKYIDVRLLAISKEEFIRYTELLFRDGFLYQKFGLYEITAKGLLHCEKIQNRKKKDIKESAKTIIECASLALQLLPKTI